MQRCWLPVLTMALAAPATLALHAPSAMAQAATPGALRAYRINPGDELEIYVWGEERLQRTVKGLNL